MAHNDSTVEEPLKVAASIVAFTLLFSIMSAFVKLAAEDGTPIATIMFWRFAFGCIPVFSYILWKQTFRQSLFHGQWLGLTSRAGMGLIAQWCTFTSLAMLPIAEATTLHFASPFIMTLLSIWVLKERVGVWRWGAILMGFVGVLLILRPDFHGAFAGQFIALCAASVMAMNMLMIRTLASKVNVEAITLYVHLVGFFVMLPIALHQGYTPSPTAFLYLIGAGFVAGFAQLLLNYCYLRAPAPYVSAFSYIQIVFVTVLGFWIFHNLPSPTFFIGAAVIVTSGLVIIVREALLRRKNAVETTPDIDL